MPPVPPDLQHALDRGALVLAPTAFAARRLRAAFDARQRAASLAAWQPPHVLSWEQWLESLWSGLILHGHETRPLLNPAQEDSLWREVITPSLDAANKAAAPRFAALARSAFALAAGYGVTGRLASAAHTEDTAQFARWVADFHRLCARHACLPAARLPAALLDHLRSHTLPPLAELHLSATLAAFGLPPAGAAFLAALRAAGTEIFEHPAPPLPPLTRFTLRAATEAEELRAVAHWLREFLDTAIADHGPAGLPSVHLVLASGSPDHAVLDSVFREVLAPELDLLLPAEQPDPPSGPASVPGPESSIAPWAVAAGRPLAAQPSIATLLRLLRGLVRALPLDEVTALLLSPHLGAREPGGQARYAAAQFDAAALRDRPPLRPELTFPELSRLARSSPLGRSTLVWLTPLLAAVREAGDLGAPRTHAAWLDFIRDLAAAAGWPAPAGPLSPQSVAQSAALRAWDHLLDSLATLDFTGRLVPFHEAFASLEHQLASATFAVPGEPLIHILSVEDAVAATADVLVLLQATDAHWPPVARPHPLLPWSLQADAGMPGAHPGRDADRARYLTETLLRAPHVLLSHAAEADGAAQRLAPALALHAAALPWRELSSADLISIQHPAVILEHILDDTPLPPLPSPHVSGGATVLELQAKCGFRAFAELRLRATEPRTPELGIDAARAGSLLHLALDHFWLRVRSQATLLALSEDDLDAHLTAAVQYAFAKVPAFQRLDDRRDNADSWEKAYRALQIERLFYLLKDWLACERDRAPFTVLGREQERPLAVGPLELRLRIDRVDTVDEESGALLIDYKTGADIRPSAWEGDRPDQPQLPLYTLLPDLPPLRGLAFARVRRGQFAWCGIQAEPNLLGRARVDPALDQLVSQWRDVLTGLAGNFAAGDHSVHPKSYPSTCAYCGQRALCRLDPQALLSSPNEENEEEADVEAVSDSAEEHVDG